MNPTTPYTGEEITGARALVASLEHAGVEVIFGLPGGAILPVYDPLIESSLRHILVRHEQGAGHMAEGYAHATGRPGVAIVTSGPGATNVVTALADAYMDSIPLVVITGQVPTTVIGTDAFQECDTVGITMPVTKHNWLITNADEIPQVIAEAFYVATTGRPGPVLVDFPKDVATSTMRWYWPESVTLPGYQPLQGVAVDTSALAAAASLMAQAERPVLYCGGGILKAHASPQLSRLVSLTGMPAVTTLMARGCLPDSHPRNLGMPGMHGNVAAVASLQRADLIVALGARFDDRVTGRLDGFAPDARVIHIDIDAAEINKVRQADVSIAGDVGEALDALLPLLDNYTWTPRVLWDAELTALARRFPLAHTQDPASPLKPQYVISELSRLASPDTIVASGVGQHQMWTSQLWQFERPHSFVNSGGLGTMGFGIPAGIGAKVARPEAPVWVIDGDGCFQMTAQELTTAAVERIPIKVALLNNAYLGMVRQWQELFYEERYSEVYLSPDLPNYVMWAEAMGCAAKSVSSACDVASAIEWANSIDDRPVVLEFKVDYREKVYPMVPSGATNDEILVADGQQAFKPYTRPGAKHA